MPDPRARVDVEAAMHAFDQLGMDGPRSVMNTLESMALESKALAEFRAPGKLRFGWRVQTMADPETSKAFGYGVYVADQTIYERRYAKRKGQAAPAAGDGKLRVAYWVNHGTGSKATSRVKAPNTIHEGQRAQRFMRKPSRAQQQREVLENLIRVARRAGFVVGAPT